MREYSRLFVFCAICAALFALFSLFVVPLPSQTVYPEIEPNNSKPQALANGPFVLGNGDAVSGTASVNLDYFLLRTTSLPLGIWRHTMVRTGSAAFSGASVTLRGRSQNNGIIDPSSDISVQLGTGGTTHAWYGFGRGEQLYYLVPVPTTTGMYNSVLSTTAVTPYDIGTFSAGVVTITTVGQVGGSSTDTDLWVYDAGFNAIPDYGNNDAFGAPVTQSTLTRTFNPGIYYLAISDENLANNLPSPADDDDRNDPVLDYPDAVVNDSTALWLINMAFTDSSGTSVFQVPKSQPLQVVWFKFTVTSPFSFFLSQPSGLAGDLIFTNGGGTAGNPYLNAISLTQGAFPNGWFYGVDIPFNLLVSEYLLGSPFSGVLNVVGGALGSISGPLPPGIQLYAVGVEFLPNYNVFRNSPPFVYLTL